MGLPRRGWSICSTHMRAPPRLCVAKGSQGATPRRGKGKPRRGEVYGAASAKKMLKKLKNVIHRLFEYYSMMIPIPDGSSSGNFSSSIGSQANVDAENVNEEEDEFEDEFRLKVRRKQDEVKRNELERYMIDDVQDNIPGFDILQW
ncbi:hypothetical protein PIB30_084874 [Stylosanthes scabra]|uniref:Uncharacterized protein n=1 Tax=Stylosanthes scabra TaxID=79078 RepID=A0ABU6WTV4_9FABA|nr:hypothetical protein [Stylosanthes scabra]